MDRKIYGIGSVVLLKGAQKRIMITGFFPTFVEDNIEKTFDYSGCPFPEGIVDSSKSMLFNHEDIENVYYLGLIDEEQTEFINYLKSAINDSQKDNKVAEVTNVENISNVTQQVNPSLANNINYQNPMM